MLLYILEKFNGLSSTELTEIFIGPVSYNSEVRFDFITATFRRSIAHVVGYN
jgi:hypothetical protein